MKLRERVTVSDLRNDPQDWTHEIVLRLAGWQDPRAAEKPRVLAVDPGDPAGGIYLHDVDRVTGKEFQAKSVYGRAVQLRDWIASTHDHHGVDVVVIEDTYLGKSVAAKADLDRQIGVVISIAASMGLSVWRVPASTWQTAMLGRQRRRDQLKALSLARAQAEWSALSWTSHHLADAALLALWARGGRVLGGMAREAAMARSPGHAK